MKHEIYVPGASFGFLFSLVLCAMYMVRPGYRVNKRFLALLCFAGGVLSLYVYFMLVGRYFQPTWLNHLYIPFVYVLGPGMYGVFMSTFEEEYEFHWNRWMFAPAALLPPLFPLLQFLIPGVFDRRPVDFFNDGHVSPVDGILIAGFLTNAVYYAIIFYRSLPVFRSDSLRREPAARLLLLMLLGSGAITSYIISAYVLRSVDVLLHAMLGTTLLAVLCFVAGQRTPNLLERLVPAVRQVYKNSRLAGLDLAGVSRALDQALGEERLYLDEELTLARLAERIELKPYQLSEYLNTHRGTNFARLVNGYRVEEATRILLEEEGASILSVAFRVGFNSKANFNLVFKSVKGVSPREFLRAERDRRGRPTRRLRGRKKRV